MEKRDILIALLFILIGVGIYYIFTNKSNANFITNHPKPSTKYEKHIILHPVPCKLAPVYVRDALDNLTSIFDGIFYDKPFLLCVRFKDYDYCIQSKIIKVNDINVAYFDTICLITKNINPNLPYVDIEYKYLSSNLNKSVILKYGVFSDDRLYKALKSS